MSKKENIEVIENQEVEQATEVTETETKKNIFHRIGDGVKKHKGKIVAGAIGLALGAVGAVIGMRKTASGTVEEICDCDETDEVTVEVSSEVTE